MKKLGLLIALIFLLATSTVYSQHRNKRIHFQQSKVSISMFHTNSMWHWHCNNYNYNYFPDWRTVPFMIYEEQVVNSVEDGTKIQINVVSYYPIHYYSYYHYPVYRNHYYSNAWVVNSWKNRKHRNSKITDGKSTSATRIKSVYPKRTKSSYRTSNSNYLQSKATRSTSRSTSYRTSRSTFYKKQSRSPYNVILKDKSKQIRPARTTQAVKSNRSQSRIKPKTARTISRSVSHRSSSNRKRK